MDVHIDPAAAGDGPAIRRLLSASGLPLDGLVDHLETTLVARTDGRLVGSATLEVHGDTALLRSVAVDTTARGSGIGQQLTQSAIDLARSRGIRMLFSRCRRTAPGTRCAFAKRTGAMPKPSRGSITRGSRIAARPSRRCHARRRTSPP